MKWLAIRNCKDGYYQLINLDHINHIWEYERAIAFQTKGENSLRMIHFLNENERDTEFGKILAFIAEKESEMESLVHTVSCR